MTHALTPGLHPERLKHIRASYEASKQGHAFIGHPSYDEQIAIIDALLAGMSGEPVGTFRKTAVGYMPSYHEEAVPLYAAPPAPVAVPEHRAAVATLESMGYTWNGGQLWKPPIGKAPAYITGEEAEPVSATRVATPQSMREMFCQLYDSKCVFDADAWNTRRAAMQAEPVTADAGWIAEAKKLAEMYGASFVMFRHGEQPVCADPTKFWFGYDPAAPEQEV
ncbi:hypothetical protein N7922_05775 [Kosakonia sp. ML.JS2a]|uniref:hypothetical protein n=1 Tax=Kosakonia sp. ML.JS2a TaxID=2980557 RepID=UPI0021D9EAFC|nr:hypothetical protein [Kosakonia sp. ML.JS2a]UXY12035.1 hypothetical protein N7922_05775 [Kosakonia sp. ML.JS2a]